ncbi:MAG: PilT/PilU family type 4a pilus ATPase [Candidatus Peribacteraceae bacterium]
MPTEHTPWSDAVDKKASDIHAVTGLPLMFRIDGELQPASAKPLTSAQVTALIKQFLSDKQLKKFDESKDIDCSHLTADGTRYRINCHVVGGQPAFAARIIPRDIPTPEELLLPPVILDLAKSRDGLILFTGPTGSGKSTSMASILQELLKSQPLNIITLEDPIEFLLPPGTGIVQQRELGSDFDTFPDGLKHVLRQDPDVVMIGEMRDLDSISLALTMAETGHLVFGTLHTPNTVQSIDRIIDVFPAHQQAQVRMQLSMSLTAVVGQRLLPKIGGGRVANREILVRTPAVSSIIRDHRLAELESVIQTGGAEGMVTFEKDLKRLVKEGLTKDEE